ncbi:MAG TPA: tol-pal system protein YbgF [Thermodesulfobacteriaceae bacterium]|nr:tol-pal system protein YbgF [Thermodesulfobacteriaceae bacterium]
MTSSETLGNKRIQKTFLAVAFRTVRIIPVFALPALLVCCAPADQVNMMERKINSLSVENRSLVNQLNALKLDIATLKKETREEGKQSISSIRSRQAELASRMDEIQAELLRLNGLIEQINYERGREKETALHSSQAIQSEIKKLREEVRLLQASTKVSRKVEQARKKAASGKLDLYQQALDLIKARKYKQAKKVLRAYIDRHPSGDRLPNAYFWLGECEYNLKHYEEAILEYLKVIDKFPKSNKVPDAMLKQGLAFIKLGDNVSAEIILQKIVDKYPKSFQARVAKKQLERLR